MRRAVVIVLCLLMVLCCLETVGGGLAYFLYVPAVEARPVVFISSPAHGEQVEVGEMVIVQAVARDVLKQGMLNAEAAGLKIIGHVHDEIIVEGPHLPELIKAMTSPPAWCSDAPIRAEGYVGDFYQKD